MRLIDADALMKSIKGYRLGKIPKGELEWKIEKAPTVDAVVLPCKVGDKVWCIVNRGLGLVAREGIVSELYFTEGMEMGIVVRRLRRGRWMKEIFPTAEAAMAEIERLENLEKENKK
jgi:hypothetical protein